MWSFTPAEDERATFQHSWFFSRIPYDGFDAKLLDKCSSIVDLELEANEREIRRATFASAADEYDRVRPGYPQAIVDSTFRTTALRAGDTVLEIGCGTGQATVAFAARGLSIVALEPSESMAHLAAAKLKDYPAVRVVPTSFEAFDDSTRFDAVLAATSFHWLDPDTRLLKSFRRLRERGWLIAMTNTHPRPYRGFFRRADVVYARVVPAWAAKRRSRTPDMVDETVRQIESSDSFRVVTHESCDWERQYSRDDYLTLLRTQSDHKMLESDKLDQVLEELGGLIDAEFGGIVVRPYRTVVIVAQKNHSISAGNVNRTPQQDER